MVTERGPVAPRDTPEAPRWDARRLREALDISQESQTFALPSPATASSDFDQEPGIGLVIGDPPRAVLELYPARRRLQLRVPGLRLELDGVDAPALGPEGVVFEQASPAYTARLSLGRDGELVLHHTPRPPAADDPEAGPTIAPAAPDDADRAIGRPVPVTPAAGDPGAPNAASETPSPATETGDDQETQEKQDRVKLFGRLATPVRFKTSQNGRLIAEFVLAERIDEERTAFHKVTAFDNPRTARLLAAKLRELVDAGELAKGKPATVVGYRHERRRPKRDGTTATEVQIYAVAVSAR